MKLFELKLGRGTFEETKKKAVKKLTADGWKQVRDSMCFINTEEEAELCLTDDDIEVLALAGCCLIKPENE